MFAEPLRTIDPTLQYVHCADENEVRYWSARLDVSPAELRKLVQSVGPKVVDLEARVLFPRFALKR
jgi:hypothetical protein